VEVGAEEAEFAHLGDEFAGEATFAEAVFDDGDEIVFDEGAGGVTHHALVFIEQGIEFEEVYVLEFEAHPEAPFESPCHAMAASDPKHLRLPDGVGLRKGFRSNLNCFGPCQI